MVGRRYRWRRRTWTVLARWAGAGPRNVLIRSDGGELVVRPFRGLRLPRWITATSGTWHRSRRHAESCSRGWRAFDVDEAHRPSFYRPCRVCAR